MVDVGTDGLGNELATGDFVLVKGHHDTVGMLICLAESLNGDGWDSEYSHAAVITDFDTTKNDWRLVEAEPGGARLGWLSAYEGNGYTLSSWPLGMSTRTVLREAALSELGVPYSFLDYGSLAARRLGLKGDRLRKYVANTGHMICSQMTDAIYLKANLHMFNDGRWPGDVTPQDLKAVLAGPK